MDLIEQVDVHTEKHSRYQITRPQHLVFVKEYLSEMNIGSGDGIIDVGCGKGGMLFEFAQYAFGKIAGLEFSKELCEIANSNLIKAEIKADIICEDAITYSDYDDYNYFYMYNPFGEEIMENVVNCINESLNRHQRTIHVIYTNPVHRGLFIRYGFKVEKKFKVSLMFTQAAVVFTK